MTNDYSRELRGILLVSLFIMVVPLVFFPKDLGLKFDSSLTLLFALELGWYLLVLFVMFSKVAASKVFVLALMTLAYRICLGIGFGVLLLVMFSLPFFSSLRLGIYHYMPAFLLQILMSPFALKSLFEVLIKKAKSIKETGGAEMSEPKFTRRFPEPVPSHVTPGQKERLGSRNAVPLEKETKATGEHKLESVLHYLREYAGVKAAVLVDHEGLVVGADSPDFDPERIASFTRCFKEINDQMLHKMGEKPAERIGIHTPDLWMCLSQIRDFTLVVLSDRRTDELFSVRISQSTSMIERFLSERYQRNVLKAVEV